MRSRITIQSQSMAKGDKLGSDRNELGVMPQGMDERLMANYVPRTSPTQRFTVDSESLDATQEFDFC